MIQPNRVEANDLTAEDLASTYTNEELGISVKIPHTWKHAISGEVIEQARETAQELASMVLDLPKEYIQKLDREGSEKAILIRMSVKSPALPAAQITTRSLTNIKSPPQSAIEHLQGYIQFVQNMTPTDIIKPVTETELNGTPCAHVTYDTQIYLEGYTYLARYDVYSFWRTDRTIDLTVIANRNGAFKTQDEMDIQTVINSARIAI